MHTDEPTALFRLLPPEKKRSPGVKGRPDEVQFSAQREHFSRDVSTDFSDQNDSG